MTCIYDTVEEVRIHVRQAVLESRGEDVFPAKENHDSSRRNGDEEASLYYPDDKEMILLLASVVVQARPAHLLATLCYADTFAWTVPTDMM